MKNKLKILIMLLLLSPISCVSKDNDYAQDTENNRTANENITMSRQNAITRVVAEASPAIVGINVTEVVRVAGNDMDDMFYYFFYGRRPQRSREVKSLGSGFIISKDGYILTNHHVAGNASKIIVTMTDGTKHNARLIGSDAVTDVALLKIDEVNNLPYLRLANSDNVTVGEWAIAFGNPFGLFDINAKPTVTVGVVSNMGVNFTSENRGTLQVYKNMIQTDAAISSGNSGGPLLNASGEVIGMNTVIFSTATTMQGAGSIGIGFAIPINRVKQIADMLRSGKVIDRNFYIGIEAREIDDQLANYLSLTQREGVIVFGIKRNSPGDKSGFEPGDIIVSINNEKIKTIDDYNIAINDFFAGQTINVVLLRDGKQISKELYLQPINTR